MHTNILHGRFAPNYYSELDFWHQRGFDGHGRATGLDPPTQRNNLSDLSDRGASGVPGRFNTTFFFDIGLVGKEKTPPSLVGSFPLQASWPALRRLRFF